MADMTRRCDVLIVGAGAVGLAAGFELAGRGADVHVLDSGAAGAEQSAGLARIFRVAHATERHVRAAQAALELWRAWERRLGRRLVGDEGLLVYGEPAIAQRAAAMRAAGAPLEMVAAGEARRRLAVAAHDGPALLDPQAGVIRVARMVSLLSEALNGRLHLHQRVLSVNAGGHVRTAGDGWQAGHVLLCAGHGTPPLAARAGLDAYLSRYRHVRFSFAARTPGPLACLIDASAYALPVGRTGAYAVGLHGADDQLDAATPWPQAVEVLRARTEAYVRATLPGLHAAAGDQVRCEVPIVDAAGVAGGDGWAVAQTGRLTAITGANLMKFVPLLGAGLADAAQTGAVPAALI
jgi:sarcosine oxidase